MSSREYIGPAHQKPVQVRLERVIKRYHSAFAIHDISVKIEPGEFFCLLGPSGSGKSTILGIIGGWVSVDSGEVWIDSKNLTHIESNRRPVRTCFQKGGFLFPHLSVRDNVAYSLRVKGVSRLARRNRAEDLLMRVGLAGFGDRLPSQLSGGEAQRVAIARTLADPQPVLLLDEIQTGLDRRLRASIRDLLVQLTIDTGTTSIYVTHDASEALGLASRLNSRIGVLENGTLEQVGNARELYNKPVSSRVAALVGDVNLLEVKHWTTTSTIVTSGGAELAFPHVPRETCYIAFRPEAAKHSAYPDSIGVRGKLSHYEFLGGITRAVISLNSEALIVHWPRDVPLVSIGSDVSLFLPFKEIHFLKS